MAEARPYMNKMGQLRDENPILMWDVETSEVVGHFFGHHKTVSALVLSSDSALLFSGSDDQTLRIWSVMDRQCLYTLRGHPAQVSAIALLPANARALDAQFVFSAGGSEANDEKPSAERDNRIRKWALP